MLAKSFSAETNFWYASRMENVSSWKEVANFLFKLNMSGCSSLGGLGKHIGKLNYEFISLVNFDIQTNKVGETDMYAHLGDGKRCY